MIIHTKSMYAPIYRNQSTTMYFDNYICHTCLLVTNINYFGKILSEFCRLFFIDKGELKSILPDGSSLLALNSVGSDSKVVVYKVRFYRRFTTTLWFLSLTFKMMFIALFCPYRIMLSLLISRILFEHSTSTRKLCRVL